MTEHRRHGRKTASFRTGRNLCNGEGGPNIAEQTFARMGVRRDGMEYGKFGRPAAANGPIPRRRVAVLAQTPRPARHSRPDLAAGDKAWRRSAATANSKQWTTASHCSRRRAKRCEAKLKTTLRPGENVPLHAGVSLLPRTQSGPPAIARVGGGSDYMLFTISFRDCRLWCVTGPANARGSARKPSNGSGPC